MSVKAISLRLKGTGAGPPRGRLTVSVVAILMGGLLLGGIGCQGFLSAQRQPQWRADSDLLTIRPAFGDVGHLLRNVHYLKLMGRTDLALKELEAAYRQQPQNLKLLDALARGYEELGDFDEAQNLYQEALAVDGANQALWNNLCYSYYLRGWWDKAEACFRQALARNPHNVAARNNLGLLLCRLGKEEEARRLWAAAEGEKGAQAKMQQVLASLGRTGPADLNARNLAEPAPVQVARQAAEPRFREGEESGLTQPQPMKGPSLAKPSGLQPQGAMQQAAQRESREKETAAGPEESAPAAPGQPRAEPPRFQGPRDSSSPAASPPEVEGRPAEGQPAPLPAPPVKPKRRLFLTAKELLETPIEVLNGNGIPKMAHHTRAMLYEHGFNVASIGNYKDWGAEQTVIRYRPEAARVAQALQSRFFHQARLKTATELPEEIQVQILLGHDLVQQRHLLARVTD